MAPPAAKKTGKKKNTKASCPVTDYKMDSLIRFVNSPSERIMRCKIIGTPRPMYRTHGCKGSNNKLHVYTVSAPNKRNLQKAFGEAINKAPHSPFFLVHSQKPVAVTTKFYFKRPKEHYTYNSITRQMVLRNDAPQFVTKKPDLDNCDKLILDALEGIVYENDSVVTELTSSKLFLPAKPGQAYDKDAGNKECTLLKVIQYK